MLYIYIRLKLPSFLEKYDGAPCVFDSITSKAQLILNNE
jgi:hypothetical protein